MSKKKKNIVPEVVTDKAKEYLNLWIDLNSSSDEKIILNIRNQMRKLWGTMNKDDIRDFHRESDALQRKKPQTKSLRL